VRRALTAAVIAAGLMAQASAVPVALAANGNLDHFDVAVSGTSTAGTALNLTVTAKDAMNRTIRAVSGAQCLVLTGLGTSPAPSNTAPSYPAQGACTIAGQRSVTFTNGVATPAVTAFRAGSNTLNVTDTTGTALGAATFSVNAATASSVTYTGAPIDTEVGTPIYSVCAPPPATSANSCATTSQSPASSPVRVQELDPYSNPATNTVTINLGTTTLGTASPNSAGVASFGESLSISTTGFKTLVATAGTGSVSAQIQIVYDLRACDGQSCKNSVDNGQRNVQRALNTITTSGGDFFVDGGANVRLATSFFNTNGECGASTFVGQGTEAQVEGNLGGTTPTTNMVLIIPKRSLQAFGVASRNADSFNVCVGVTSFVTGTPAWTGTGTVTQIGNVFWGTVADCSAFPSGSSNPCAAVKTKNVGDVVAYFNSINDPATAASIPSLMENSDLAIVIHKGYPWDGKAGIYS